MVSRQIVYFAVMGIIVFSATPTLGAGWLWDADNALGFTALVGMIFLTVPGGARRHVRQHEYLGYAVLFAALIHALYFLLWDDAAIEYIKPSMPLYMWSGVIGLIALGVLTLVAVFPLRRSMHKSYKSFRSWHKFLAILSIAGVLHHIIGSGLYVRTWYQGVLLIAVAILAKYGPTWLHDKHENPTPAAYVGVSLIAIAIFSGVRNFPA